jgi:hypothetical protein
VRDSVPRGCRLALGAQAMGTWRIKVSWRDGSTSLLHYQDRSAPQASGDEISLPDRRDGTKTVRLKVFGRVSYSPPLESCVACGNCRCRCLPKDRSCRRPTYRHLRNAR